MKLWSLWRYGKIGWDEARAFVVRAETKDEARRLAASQAGDEGSECWMGPRLSACELLSETSIIQHAEVICRDSQNG